MIIRLATDADKDKVLEFCRNTFSWGDYIAEVWDIWKSQGNMFVAETNEIVGFYHLFQIEEQMWVEGMRVRPEFRRQGIGRQMLSHAESLFPNSVFRLIVESQNQPSLNLVGSMGYETESKWYLYNTCPKKEKYSVTIMDASQVGNLNVSLYCDSWRWFVLSQKRIAQLSKENRVIGVVEGGVISAVGIWGRFQGFPKVLQLSHIKGLPQEISQIISYARTKAHEFGCDRLQIFSQTQNLKDVPFLEQRATFHLMKKDLCKKTL